MFFAHLANTSEPLCAVFGERLVRLNDVAAGVHCLDDLLRADPATQAMFTTAARTRAESGGAWDAPTDSELAAPLLRPSKIVCVGLNYRDHAEETGIDAPEQPLIFAKFPSSLSGPSATIGWPAGLTEQVDWEGELAVVIGRSLRNVAADEAMAGVFGYTVANDVSARDLQFGDVQWTRGKSLDGFCPLGPAVVTADEVYDPQSLALTTRRNGEVVQRSNTSQMIFGLAEIISFVSGFCTLLAGDLILTGTPHGVGAFRDPPLFMGAGDVIEVEIEGIGTISNPVAGPFDPGAAPVS